MASVTADLSKPCPARGCTGRLSWTHYEGRATSSWCDSKPPHEVKAPILARLATGETVRLGEARANGAHRNGSAPVAQPHREHPHRRDGEASSVNSESSFLRTRGNASPERDESRYEVTAEAIAAFPLAVLPELSRRFVEESARALGCPPDYIGVPHLALAGAAIGNARRLELKPGYVQRASLFACIVGPPGSAKTPGLSAARAPMDALQREARDVYHEELADYRGDATAWSKQSGPKPEVPRMRHFFTTDVTIEAVAGLLEHTSGLAVVADELSTWVSSFNSYRQGKGGDRQHWLSIWASVVPLKVDRKTAQSIYVTDPHVCVVGGIQPDLLPSLIDEAGRHDGFVDRLLFAWPESAPGRWSDDAVDYSAVAEVTALFRSLVNYQGNLTVRLSPAAKVRFVKWFNANADRTAREVGLLAGMRAKAPNQLARLCLVLHCLAHPSPIDPQAETVTDETMAAAITLLAYFHAHARRVLRRLGPAAIDPPGIAGKVLRLLRRWDGQWANRTAMHSALGDHTAAADLSIAVSDLVAKGVIEHRETKPQGGGRPKHEYRYVAVRRNEFTELTEETHDSTATLVEGTDENKASREGQEGGDEAWTG